MSKSKISIFIIMLILIIVSSNLNWSRDNWKGIIEVDAKGYYAYLPATFIYQDLNFGFFDEIEKEKYYNENWFYDYRSNAEGKVINKYYCGTALVESPFFLVAHFLSYLFGYEMDGYSKLYPILINIGGLFYLLIGLLYLNSTLKKYNISDIHRIWILLVTVFATNLFYYSVVEPGMSHVFSFAFIAMFFYYAKEYFSSLKKWNVIKLFVILGIIVLIRPLNGLIIFILPFAAGNFNSFKNGVLKVFQYKLQLFLGLLFFFSIVAIQLIVYRISTGHFFVYSYLEEGFNFLNPHIMDILFSYKKGLFLYTPIFLLSLGGGYFIWKSSKFAFYSLFAFLFLITYILSSWWMWYYGGSFSSRVYVEYIPIFMIPLAISLSEIKLKLFKRLYLFILVLLVVLCQIQTYQYRYFEIHWDNMNQEKYWDVFLRIDKLIK